MSYRQLTLKDIAKELDTSITTVSRALKGHPSISEKMRQRVQELAKELDYQPNPIAVNLLKSRSFTIGVIIPEIVHGFYSMVLEGIEDTAIEAGYTVMFCLSKESVKREQDVLNALLGRRIDGLLIAPSKETTSCKHLESLIRKEVPFIFMDRYCEELPVSKVLVDDYKGAFTAVTHLLSTGCKRIAHISGPESLSNGRRRMTGYIDALKKGNQPVNSDYIVHCDLTRQSARASTKKLIELKKKPDAIFAYNSSIAFESMLMVKELGLRIPKDVAFAGFANEPMISYSEPQLTTVLQPAYQIGQEAVKLLLKQMEMRPEQYKPQTLILQPELAIKASSQK